MNALLERIKKASKTQHSDTLSDSKLFESDLVTTDIPMFNVALSGSLDGGLTSGVTCIAGPSKHFKSSYGLLVCSAYLKKHKDSVILFYDSEFGSPKAYFSSFGIDQERVFHTPITNIEELKFDMVSQLQNFNRTDKVIIMIDSIGNLASKKEVEDAINEKSVADMTRAKALKGLFRMVTPLLKMKDIPLIVINHTYKEQTLYPKDIVSGGCLVSGTLIQTLSGLKSVETIERGDIVYTLDGEKMVTDCWTPETLEFGEPECYEVSFEDGTTVTCSAQHPFLTDSGWIDAEDMSIGIEVKKVTVS